jgi:hypothetical protein
MQRLLLGMFGSAIILGTAAAANALDVNPIPVGTGTNRAYVQVDFNDDAVFLFDVKFTGAPTAFDLIRTVDAQLDFDLQYSLFGDSAFVTGIGFQGHSDLGDGAPFGESWWHNWSKQAGTWQLTDGASSVIISDGAWNAWNFQFPWPGVAPQTVTVIPEPVALSLLAACIPLLVRHRRA